MMKLQNPLSRSIYPGAFTSSKLTIETQEQGVKYVHGGWVKSPIGVIEAKYGET